MKHDMILVLDFGGQYCHLIARRIRENSVYSEIIPCDITPSQLAGMQEEHNVRGIILSGGPSSIYEKDAPQLDVKILDSGLPVLGICYGHQLLAHRLRGRVVKAKRKEFGIASAKVSGGSALLKGLSPREQVWMSHGDTVLNPPEGSTVIATTDNCPVAAFQDEKRKIYGVQWHPEVVHTTNGEMILRNFVFGICRCRPDWKVGDLVEQYVNEVREAVKGQRAIIALSGGIDSSTSGAIAARAIGRNLTAVFIDNGLMRENEPERISDMARALGITYVHVDARARFLRKLKGIADPEQKRKVIGNEFIRIFEEEAEKVGARYLIQGTIYPDRIESGISKKSRIIKTHHNVGGLPETMKFEGLVEPLRELYKDEVRKVATRLGLPKEMINRQPFPGPGLAVRIVGEVTSEKIGIVRKADAIVTDEIVAAGLDDLPWQYFAVLTDTKSTGVKGDSRSYGSVIAIRAVGSKDAMTAEFSRIPYGVLERISTRITNEIDDAVRVVYDITNKPPSTIEWE